nr:SusD/RagB family nutrient-binding outer membrane lipoprotein [Pseudopedobacter sp.]
MKILKNNIIITFLAGATLFASCSSDFGDLNTSPNGAKVPVTSALLTNGIVVISSSATFTGREFLTNPMLYVQYFSQTQYPDESQYSLAAANWGPYYSGVLEDFQKIIDVNKDPATKDFAANSGSTNNQIAVARILKAYVYGRVTDILGDIPYSEALQGNPSPKYDTQESIYKDLIKELTEAVAQFDNGATVKGDILFNGSNAKWQKFANSLRMSFALRLSKQYPGASEYAATQFKAALNDSHGYVSTNADNVYYTHLEDNNFRNPFATLFDGRADYAPSAFFINKLKDFNDPRLPVYATPITNGSYKGIPYGLKRDVLLQWELDNPEWSLMGKALQTKTAKNYIISANMMLLARAEAAQKGWTTEVAATLYNDAVKAGWEQYGVFDATAYATYITDPKTAFATNPLTQIGIQRWIGFYPNNGFEAWAAWRRTGVPALTPSAYAVNESKQIVRRYLYPSNEFTLNGDNLQQAITRQGPDKDNTRVWWDKQ